MSIKRLTLVFLMLMVTFPTMALAIYKPTRVLVPQLFGVECPTQDICIDDLSKRPEAEQLRKDALTFVNQNIGKILNPPRIIFCHTDECADAFGQYHAAAYNVGTVGIVIRTKGWEKHYVRHELIHHLQNERLGSINAFLTKPTWFLEGMAYSLSRDPRRSIPNKQIESYRVEFENWDNGTDIWSRAAKLNRESRP